MAEDDKMRALMLLLNQCDQHWQEMRHIEGQRSTLTNLILVLSTAIVAFITQNKITNDPLPISIFIIFLGVFGVLATYKLYERHRFAQSRLDKWYEKLDKLAPEAELIMLKQEADTSHRNINPILNKMSLHKIWMFFYLALIIIGGVLPFVRG